MKDALEGSSAEPSFTPDPAPLLRIAQHSTALLVILPKLIKIKVSGLAAGNLLAPSLCHHKSLMSSAVSK